MNEHSSLTAIAHSSAHIVVAVACIATVIHTVFTIYIAHTHPWCTHIAEDCVCSLAVSIQAYIAERAVCCVYFIIYLPMDFCMVNVNISYCFSLLFKRQRQQQQHRRRQQQHKTLVSLSDIPVIQPIATSSSNLAVQKMMFHTWI